jgi:hypothetical protein
MTLDSYDSAIPYVIVLITYYLAYIRLAYTFLALRKNRFSKLIRNSLAFQRMRANSIPILAILTVVTILGMLTIGMQKSSAPRECGSWTNQETNS